MNDIIKKLYFGLSRVDEHWMQRKRKITTASVFSALCSASLNRRGFKHIIDADNSCFSAQALQKARTKIPANSFRDINRLIQRPSVNKPCTYAIDGSKVHVHPCFVKSGYKSRTNDQKVSTAAVRPICMLSSMLNVKTRTCYDSVVSSHFNERTSALHHMHMANPRDTLIFDRGYYSKELFAKGADLNLNLLFRVKCDACKPVKTFYHSYHTTQRIVMHINGTAYNMYMFKYFIDGRKYVCVTNYKSTPLDIKRQYSLRWRVETSFRRLKTDLNLEDKK
jgi:Transposase DDE domain